MDELRGIIWDFLYRGRQPASLDDLARHTGCDEAAVQAAVDHEWFEVNSNGVQIAYGPRT